MSNKSWIATAFLTATLVFAGSAYAAEPYLPRAQKVFDRIDLNKDGKVDVKEFTPLAEKRFMKADENKDDAVSLAEIDGALKAAMERRRDRMMLNLDMDKNGSITRAELDKYVEALVKGADVNGDGGVTFEEARLFKVAKWRKTKGENLPN